MILSFLQSVINCGGRQYKICHLSLNLLLHFLQNLDVQIYTSAAVGQFKSGAKSIINSKYL